MPSTADFVIPLRRDRIGRADDLAKWRLVANTVRMLAEDNFRTPLKSAPSYEALKRR